MLFTHVAFITEMSLLWRQTNSNFIFKVLDFLRLVYSSWPSLCFHLMRPPCRAHSTLLLSLTQGFQAATQLGRSCTVSFHNRDCLYPKVPCIVWGTYIYCRKSVILNILSTEKWYENHLFPQERKWAASLSKQSTPNRILELVKSSGTGQRASMNEDPVPASTTNRNSWNAYSICVFRGLTVNCVPSTYHSLPELLKHT